MLKNFKTRQENLQNISLVMTPRTGLGEESMQLAQGRAWPAGLQSPKETPHEPCVLRAP